MAFPSSQYGAEARWSHIQGILDVLTGVSGGGDQVQLIQYNNSSNYALDVRNLDTTNGYGLRVRDGASANLLTVAKNAIGIGATTTDILTVSATARFADGLVGTPGIAFSADTNTGLYRIGTDEIGMAIGGALRHDFADGLYTLTKTAIGATPADTHGLVLQNTTAAAAGAQQYSPNLRLRGYGWKTDATAASQSVDFRIYNLSHQGTSAPGGTLVVESAINGGAYTRKFSVTNDAFAAINEDANTNMTVGLTINQGANDNEAFAIKSSDVAHGVTTVAETDTYFTIQKNSATAGEALLTGFGAGGSSGLILRGINGVDQTAKSAAARAPVELRAYVASGTTAVIPPTADSNLVVIMGATTTRFIFDLEGSAHAEVEWIAFDDLDDVALLNRLDAAMTRDPVKTHFGAFLGEYRRELQEAKIANFYDDGPRAMVNMTRLSMLLTGAIRQMARRLEVAERHLAALPGG